MDETNGADKVDDVMLPGFRFHPTDEELVGFYLKRKVQQRSLPIELIKQVDIYKYDPWDLPKLASTGEKEWYFYCPRDRKYRNSARPNRVTGAGFWKATGTDRPIYSSDGNKCIGLKKSLVFYRGRAAKGIKTDWMMHEFRLPSLGNTVPQKKPFDRSLPANDSWAICRIFKKANTMAQRALSHSWVSPSPAAVESNLFSNGSLFTQFSPDSISCISDSSHPIQLCYSTDDLQKVSTAGFTALDPSFQKLINATPTDRSSLLPIPNDDLPSGLMLSNEMLAPPKGSVDVASMLLNMSQALIGDVVRVSEAADIEWPEQQLNGFSINLLQGMQGNAQTEENEASLRKNPSASHTYDSNHQWENVRSAGFPFGLPSNVPEAWKPNLIWDQSPSTSPSDMSTSYSTSSYFT